MSNIRKTSGLRQLGTAVVGQPRRSQYKHSSAGGNPHSLRVILGGEKARRSKVPITLPTIILREPRDGSR